MCLTENILFALIFNLFYCSGNSMTLNRFSQKHTSEHQMRSLCSMAFTPRRRFVRFMLVALSCSEHALLMGAEKNDQPLPDKSSYTLFNPTPRAFMRELSADRPDKTDTTYTVD